MGRNAKAIALQIAQGNPNRLTKAEIEYRKESEVKLGLKELSKLVVPAFVQNDLVAFRYWKQHLEEYIEAARNGIEILTTSDVGIFALYCKTYAEYECLLEKKEKYSWSILCLDEELKLDRSINHKMDMLIKMQDRLFLNPLAKVKNVSKQPPTKPDDPLGSEYGV